MKTQKKVACLLICLLMQMIGLSAQTIIVNSVGDDPALNASVSPDTAVHGVITLRSAIEFANLNNASNTINFDFGAASAPYTIVPATSLPDITNPIIIDGYFGSPGGATPNTNTINDPSGNNAVVTVELRGPGAGVNLPVFNGLQLSDGSDGSVIRGIAVNNFANLLTNPPSNAQGIRIDSNNNSVQGCFIGTDTQGNPLTNARGIRVSGLTGFAAGNTIGGDTPDARNLIIGARVNTSAAAVYINTFFFTTVTGNTIGLSKDGSYSPATDTNYGVLSEGCPLVCTNNVIAGHSAANILIFMASGTPSPQIISGNYIGTTVDGSQGVQHNGRGILLESFLGNVPNPYTIDSNVISGCTTAITVGQNLFFPIIGASITNNLIGLDATGNFAIPNSRDGVLLASAMNTFIAANTISGNGGNGIRSIKAKNSNIQSNLIGLTASGNGAVGNFLNGIQLGDVVAVGVPSFGDTVGGATLYSISSVLGAGNIIAYNGGHGIRIVSYTQQETIQGNTIFANGMDGIHLGVKSSDNWVGGFRSAGNLLLAGDLQEQLYTQLGPIGTSNEIYNNVGNGISLSFSNGNTIQANFIHENGQRGIFIKDSSDNLIGGELALPLVTNPPTLGNSIYDNGSQGVVVEQKHRFAHDNAIISNSIDSNNKEGIELRQSKAN